MTSLCKSAIFVKQWWQRCWPCTCTVWKWTAAAFCDVSKIYRSHGNYTQNKDWGWLCCMCICVHVCQQLCYAKQHSFYITPWIHKPHEFNDPFYGITITCATILAESICTWHQPINQDIQATSLILTFHYGTSTYHDMCLPLWRYSCKLDPQVTLWGTFFWGYSDHIFQNRRLYNTLTYVILEFFTRVVQHGTWTERETSVSSFAAS